MTKDHRYTLASNKFPKLNCPYCEQPKHWQRYFDKETGAVLPEKYGLCDNSSKCGKGLNPYTDGYNKMEREFEYRQRSEFYKSTRTPLRLKLVQKPDSVVIPPDVFKQTLQGYEQNVFLQNLLYRVEFPFEARDIEKIISLYYLGTVCKGYRSGAITLPYIDINGGVRAIQVKQFNEANHTISTDFIHSIIVKYHTKRGEPLPDWLEKYKKQEKYVSCLFGEHLLRKYPFAPVALVEAPKTAVCCTLYFGFPDKPENLIWLAVYNKSSFSIDKLSVLQGRDVYVFPDLSKDGSTFSEWQQKAKHFEEQLPGTRFIFYDLLEQIASDELKEEGADIADVLIKLDWRGFRKQMIQKEPIPGSSCESVTPETQTREKCEKREPSEKHFYSQDEALPGNQVAAENSNQNMNGVSLVIDKQDTVKVTEEAIFQPIEDEKKPKYQTYGELFDLLKARGYKTLPKNMQIIIPGWN